MRRLPIFIVSFGILAVLAMSMRTIAQDNSSSTPPPSQNNDQNGPADGPPPRGPGGPGGFHLLPRFVMEKLDLTDDQKDQVRALEKDTKAKLEKILTPAQMKVLQETRPPRRPGPGGPDGQGAGPGPGGDGGGPDAGADHGGDHGGDHGADHGGDHGQGGGSSPQN
jgi:Spy/CpxP family protein refolding chaperone